MASTSFIHSVKSRQKHRRWLGVGETDGKIPRSKISQLLGTPVSNSVILDDEDSPAGLFSFLWLSCAFFAGISLVGLLERELFDKFVKWYLPENHQVNTNYNHLMYQINQLTTKENNQHTLELVQQIDLFVMTLSTQLWTIYNIFMLMMTSYVVFVLLRHRHNRMALQSCLIIVTSYFMCELIFSLAYLSIPTQPRHVIINILRLFAVMTSSMYLMMVASQRSVIMTSSRAGSIEILKRD